MAENESQSQTNVKGGGSKKIIVTAAVVVVAIGVAAAAYFATHKPEEAEKKETITPENVEERVDEIFESESSNVPAYYTATQNSTWNFADGSAATHNVYVENVTDNSTPVYFDLIVDETGEVVYSSPVLELGAKLDGFKLDTPLEKGEYDCTVVYHLIDDEQNTLTTVNVGVTVIVEK